MRFILLVLCCCLGLSASAQWYRVDLKVIPHKRYPLLDVPSRHLATVFPSPKITKLKIYAKQLNRSDYSLEAAEAVVMHTAQHNMRFRVYADASYNFSELAKLYIQQNRFSEAKWYLLQSNIISRSENDDHHTILNLMDLASIKVSIGDYDLAQQDLTEAHDIACFHDLKEDMAAVDKKIIYLKQNKLSTIKTDTRYAESAEAEMKLNKANQAAAKSNKNL
jgi:hypothetical protein